MKNSVYSEFLSEVATVLRLVLVLPSTNAQSERVFSTLKNVKTYLRNSMGQERLNHAMVLRVHKKETEKMSLASIANEFASRNERRKNDFGVNKFI